MPSFSITSVSNTLPLDAQRQGTASFTVKNTTRLRLRGIASIKLAPGDEAAAAWLRLVPPSGGDPNLPPEMRDFSPEATQQFQIAARVPVDAPARSYSLRLSLANDANPDDDFAESSAVILNVPAVEIPKEEKKPLKIPIWAIIAAVVVLLLIIGGIIFLATRTPSRALLLTTQDGVFTLEPDQTPQSVMDPGGPAVWSPDGRRMLVFDHLEGVYAVLTREGDREGEVNGFLDDIGWSPDGRWMSGVQVVEASAESLRIRLIQDAGPIITNGLDCAINGFDAVRGSPAWSPDSRRLAFVQNGSVFIANLGQLSTSVCPTPAQSAVIAATAEAQLDWSPDGRQIVLANLNATNSTSIALLSPDSPIGPQNPRNIAQASLIVHAIRWSPDGRQIAYVGCRDVGESERPCEVEVINADGSGRRTLHSFNVFVTFRPHLDW